MLSHASPFALLACLLILQPALSSAQRDRQPTDDFLQRAENRVWLIDNQGAPDADFLDLARAVAVARDGDTVFVRPSEAAYAGFLLDGKSVDVLVEREPETFTCGPITVRNASPHRIMTLRGAEAPRITVEDAPGGVVVERSAFAGLGTTANLARSAVVFFDCSFEPEGTDNRDHGVLAFDCDLGFYDCTSIGTDARNNFGGGGHGVFSLGTGSLFAADCRFVGGDGRLPTMPCNAFLQNDGSTPSGGGLLCGLDVVCGATRCTLVLGRPTCPYNRPFNSVSPSEIAKRVIESVPAIPSGGSHVIRAHGLPHEQMWVFFAERLHGDVRQGLFGSLHTSTAAPALFAGLLDYRGDLTWASSPLHLPPGRESLDLVVQPLFLDPGGAGPNFLGRPTTLNLVTPGQLGYGPDCNANGSADALDVLGAQVSDWNRNLLPDDCLIDSDCNANGVPDVSELYAQTEPDLNHDFRPDTCDSFALFFVDDDAPGDPGPGDPLVSDPLEDGSRAHPFDTIQDTIGVAFVGAVILVADGVYEYAGGAGVTTLRSEDGPANCILRPDPSDPIPDLLLLSGDGVIKGFTLEGLRVRAWGGLLSDCVVTGFVGSGAGHSSRVLTTRYDARIVDCAIVGNTVSDVCELRDESVLENCTIAGNLPVPGVTGASAVAINATDDLPRITNCIFSNPMLGWELRSIFQLGDSVSVDHTLIEGGLARIDPSALEILVGPGFLDVVPSFRDPAAGDYRLDAGSPARDAGRPGFLVRPYARSADGLPRVSGPTIDMGAFEVP